MLLHARVGDERRPASDREIDDITNKMSQMEGNGFIATDHRVDLKLSGAEGKALRAEGYLKFFKSRVLTGLWLSETAVGESGASRNTGDIFDDIRQDKTIELMNILKTEMQTILIEFLLEAGPNISIDWCLKPENIPNLFFPEVDVNKKILTENHAINLFTNNIVTQDEARRLMGKEPLEKSEQKMTYVQLVTIPTKKAGVKPIVPKVNGASKEAVQKTNQFGTKPGPSRTKNYLDPTWNYQSLIDNEENSS